MFIIQFFLNFLGTGEHSDFDEGDASHFKWLSKQTITGFLMFFGWTGITCQQEFKLQNSVTLLLSFLVGLLTIFLTGMIFKTARKLQSSGYVFNIEESIGKEASVYQQIPKDGIGKITISLQDCTFEINAISHNREQINSFTRVQVIKKIDDTTVVVATLK